MTRPIISKRNNENTVLRPPKNLMYLVEKKEGFSGSTSIKLPFYIYILRRKNQVGNSKAAYLFKKSEIAALFFSLSSTITDPAWL